MLQLLARRARAVAFASSTTLVATGCGVSPSPGGGPVTLSATPAAFTFSLDQLPAQTVTFAAAGGVPTPLAFSFADPTVAGVASVLPISGGVAVAFVGVAHGSTAIDVTAAGRKPATVTATSAQCGRPENLAAGTQLIFPAPGATAVPTGIGTLYFAVASVTSARPNLHLVVGAHGALEAGALTPATPPPGAVSVTPPPTGTFATMSVAVPALASGTAYRTQLYDDACQPAVLTGDFST